MLYYYIIMVWDHRRLCGPSLTETSLCGGYLYIYHSAWKCNQYSAYLTKTTCSSRCLTQQVIHKQENNSWEEGNLMKGGTRFERREEKLKREMNNRQWPLVVSGCFLTKTLLFCLLPFWPLKLLIKSIRVLSSWLKRTTEPTINNPKMYPTVSSE